MRNNIVNILLLVLSCVILHESAHASEGDRDVEFQNCLASCVNSGCKITSKTLFGLFPDWSCKDECSYNCMWDIEDSRRRAGKAPRQYYGKWPFKRLWGIQEPLSTLFSVINGVPHCYEMLYRRHLLAPKQLEPTLRTLSFISGFVGINTWVWSAAFHARDTWLTERLDYHFATLHMLFYLWYAICRLAVTFRPRQVKLITLISGLLLGSIFVHHVWYMNYVVFDYGWNMIITGVFVATQFIMWMFWAAATILSSDPGMQGKPKRVAWMIVRFQLLLMSFAAFEAFDFPPVFDSLDAHAVWHGLTPPLVVYWYMFRETDALLLSSSKRNGSKI